MEQTAPPPLATASGFCSGPHPHADTTWPLATATRSAPLLPRCHSHRSQYRHLGTDTWDAPNTLPNAFWRLPFPWAQMQWGWEENI